MGVSAGLCSYWQARMSLHGTEWQFGLVENLPDDTGSQPRLNTCCCGPGRSGSAPFNLTSSTPDFCRFTTNLFFGNRAYELDCRCYVPRQIRPNTRSLSRNRRRGWVSCK